jgi:hypothetical protein
MKNIFGLVLVSAMVFACGDLPFKKGKASSPEQERELERESGTAVALYPTAHTGLEYAQSETSDQAWIFLVAGSLRGANFAQEVIDQRNMWLKRGRYARRNRLLLRYSRQRAL